MRACKPSCRGRSIAAGLVLAAFSRAAQADETVEATPYRPTVSNPAQLSAPGYLELEAGGEHEVGNGSTRQSLPYLLKYAFTPDWGVLLGGDALLHGRDDDDRRRYAFGNTSVLVKFHRTLDDDLATGVEAGVRFPTGGGAGLGGGQADYIVNGILSDDFGPIHVDVNAGPTWIGAREAGTGRIETDEAAAASASVSRHWTLATEISATQQRRAGDTAQVLAAAAFSASRRTVLDFGAARGLTRVATPWTLFAGVTAVIGRLR